MPSGRVCSYGDFMRGYRRNPLSTNEYPKVTAIVFNAIVKIDMAKGFIS
jgi:hypothetical protein